jgi:hypothetical protein
MVFEIRGIIGLEVQKGLASLEDLLRLEAY